MSRAVDFDHVAATTQGARKRTRIRLWDLPVRVFHWSLVLAVGTAVVTGELGGSWMTLHGQAGLAIVGLVVFRLVWGLIGSTHARFVRFAPTPGRLKAYLRGRWAGVGHNPLGALSVFALLALLAAQAGTGLFSNDDIAFSGPLFNLVDEALAGRLTGLHKQLANALLALLALHIAAIAFYVGLKKDNLVKPMLTGWKDVERGESAEHGGPLAFIVALAIALAAVFAVSGAMPSAANKPAAAIAPKPAW
jgi:cytochrome b